MIRIPIDTTYISLAQVLSLRSTCLDKQVGCIITNKSNEIIASGYNGAPRGVEHCIDIGHCIKDESDNPAKCPSAHAEQNALLQCRVPEQIHTVYLTLSPCISCIRILMNTSRARIVFLTEHKHIEPQEMWRGEWCKYEIRGYVQPDQGVPCSSGL